MNNIDLQYQKLLQDILDNGVKKKDRTGTGTISVFGRQIRHTMSEGFPLLTTKKVHWKSVVTELLWFLRGDTNIEFLHKHNNHIWDGDYKKSGRTDGELGPIYGKQWRSWEVGTSYLGNDEWTEGKDIDQIQNLINELKTNPDSRRLMVSAWNVGELDQMVLPPCHYGFQVYTRELSLEERIQWVMKNRDIELDNLIITEEAFSERTPQRAISLMWNQRSVDTFLGLPFNIASYGLLLEIIAKEVNMVPDELIGNLGDVHLYTNHIEQAKEQIGRELTVEERVKLYEAKTNVDTSFFPVLSETLDFHNIPKRTREPYPLPTLKFEKNILENIFLQETVGRDKYNVVRPEDFILENYQSHPAIKAPLSN